MSSSSVSHPLPPPWHFTISLNSNDLLRVIDAPESLIPTIRDIIQTSWYRGIQGVLRYAGSWEFKLKGTPWWADGQETVEARILILKLMEMLHAVGWSPIASIDSSRKVTDKSSLIFRQSQPRQSPFFCLSLHKTDTLRLINAHEDVARVCCKCNWRLTIFLHIYTLLTYLIHEDINRSNWRHNKPKSVLTLKTLKKMKKGRKEERKSERKIEGKLR